MSASPSNARVVDDDSADLDLWISNQSFLDGPVVVTVEIDGTHLLTESFEVGTQHNWVRFPVQVGPGDHTVNITSDTGAAVQPTFTLPAGERRYAAVQYARREGQTDGNLDWHIDSQPIAFM